MMVGGAHGWRWVVGGSGGWVVVLVAVVVVILAFLNPRLYHSLM